MMMTYTDVENWAAKTAKEEVMPKVYEVAECIPSLVSTLIMKAAGEDIIKNIRDEFALDEKDVRFSVESTIEKSIESISPSKEEMKNMIAEIFSEYMNPKISEHDHNSRSPKECKEMLEDYFKENVDVINVVMSIIDLVKTLPKESYATLPKVIFNMIRAFG